MDVKPEFGMSDSAVSPLLGKRKRSPDGDADNSDSFESGDDDNGSDASDNDSLTIPDDDFMVPEDDSCSDADEREGHDDESDNDMDVDDVPQEPYSESMEPYPECPIYDSEIANISKKLVGIPQQALDILEGHDVNSKQVNAQIDAAKKLTIVPKGTKLRIGLLGDAGAGKSALLNSITDLDDLAKSLSGGQSCTCVPTEYSSAFPKQRKAFAASVRYFNIERIRHVLQEMLEDYNLFVFEHDRDWDEDQRTRFKRAMQNALKTFRVLFCDLKQFSNDQVAKDFLKTNYDDESVNAIGMFVESCEVKLKTKITSEHGYAEFMEASTRAKLRDMIDPLMGAKSTGDKPALWPLVRHVIIGVRGSRVLENATIVDLPGISDTNTVRVDLCKQYIKLCDYLWIVAPIKRVVDDGSVYNLLATYGQRFKGKVAVICTHADESVDRKVADQLRDSGCEVGAYYDTSRQWKDKKKEVTATKQKIAAMRKLKKPTKPMILDVQASEDMLKVLYRDWAAIDATRFEFLVKARAAFVATQLQEEMQSHLPPGSALTIFCVSNSHYGAHKGATKVSGPRLCVQETGIPALRAHVLALPAPLLMARLDAFTNHTVTAFLKGAQMWIETASVKRRSELIDTVCAPKTTLKGIMQKHSENFTTVATEGVVKALNMSMGDILKVALKKLEEKQQKHYATIRAFIRKGGNHSTKLCPRESWNESFTREVFHVVTADGPSWIADFTDNINVTKGSCIADLQRVLVSIGEHQAASVLPMDKIRDLIEAQIVGIETIFDEVISEYQKDFGNIMLDMTQDSDKNYFSRAMKPVYDECKIDSGTGVTKRSLAKLEKHLAQITEASPFACLQRCAIKALHANDRKHINKNLMAKISRIHKSLHAAFDGMVQKTVEEPKEAKARLALKAALPQLQADLDSTKKDLISVKQKYATVLN